MVSCSNAAASTSGSSMPPISEIIKATDIG